MVKITSFNKADSLAIYKKINMPLVIIKGNNCFNGFIPGITKNDIVCETLEECKIQLKQHATQIVELMAKNNVEFPFFPTKEEILQDFKNVVYIKFITVTSNNR